MAEIEQDRAGSSLWASDMRLVEVIDRPHVEHLVAHVLAAQVFSLIFRRCDDAAARGDAS